MTKLRIPFVALLAAASLLGAACGEDDPTVGDIASEGAENVLDAADEARQTAEAAKERTDELGDAAAGVASDVADGPESGTVSLAVVDSTIEGDTAVLTVEVSGVTIVAPNGDESGTSGHFHVFVDRDPLAEGEVIPAEAGIVHSASNPIRVPALTPGEHKLTVVLGDGNHQRIHGEVEDEVTVKIG